MTNLYDSDIIKCVLDQNRKILFCFCELDDFNPYIMATACNESNRTKIDLCRKICDVFTRNQKNHDLLNRFGILDKHGLVCPVVNESKWIEMFNYIFTDKIFENRKIKNLMFDFILKILKDCAERGYVYMKYECIKNHISLNTVLSLSNSLRIFSKITRQRPNIYFNYASYDTYSKQILTMMSSKIIKKSGFTTKLISNLILEGSNKIKYKMMEIILKRVLAKYHYDFAKKCVDKLKMLKFERSRDSIIMMRKIIFHFGGDTETIANYANSLMDTKPLVASELVSFFKDRCCHCLGVYAKFLDRDNELRFTFEILQYAEKSAQFSHYGLYILGKLRFEGRFIKKDTIVALQELQEAAKVNQDAQNYLTRIALYHKK
jgi:hypothetical protein